LKAIPQNLAYGLSALIDAKGGPVAAAPVETEAAETPAGVEEAGSPASDDAPTEVGDVTEEAPAAETETEAPADASSEPAE
jgi:hypothetical protein